MRESIYVCAFSSGLIKVGRSIDPVGRIAQHANRVSCAGIDLVEMSHAECVGTASVAERLLIGKCRESATSQHKSEWFKGLLFSEVASWVSEISSSNDGDGEDLGMWTSIISDLLASGLTQTEIAFDCGELSQSLISQLYRGDIKNPSWPIGEALRKLHADRCGTKKAA
jgi:hypothetical protein